MEFWIKNWGERDKVNYYEFLAALCKEHSLDPKFDISWLRGASLLSNKLGEEKFTNLLRSSGGIYVKVSEGADVDYMYRNYYEWTCKRIQLNDNTIAMFRNSIMSRSKRNSIGLGLALMAIAVLCAIVFGIYRSNSGGGRGRGMGILIGGGIGLVFFTIPYHILRNYDSKKAKKVKNELIDSTV